MEKEKSSSSQDELDRDLVEHIQEVVEDFPDNMPEEEKAKLILQSLEMTFSGPLPPAEYLIKYNEATPDAADRIIAMAESNQKHRQDNISRQVEGTIKFNDKGQNYGFIITLTLIVAACFMAYIDMKGFGILFAIPGVLNVFSQLVKQILPEKNENKVKNKEDEQ